MRVTRTIDFSEGMNLTSVFRLVPAICFVLLFYLFISIYLSEKSNKKKDQSRLAYLFFFPLFTFVVLWYLPMVKSLFILTTMVFSDTVNVVRKVIFPEKKAEVKTKAH